MGCKENFRRNLQFFVKEAGYDRKSFCKEVNVSYTTFSEWWTGRHLPKDTLIDDIANKLHVTVGTLFEDEESKETHFNHSSAYASLIMSEKPYMVNLIKAADKIPMDKILFLTKLIENYKE